MPTTERWIEWSTKQARPYYNRDRQLYLEIAMGRARGLRELRGHHWGRDQELACAEHYWYARWTVSMLTGAGYTAAGLPVGLLSDPAGQFFGYGGAAAGSVYGGLAMIALSELYDLLKHAAFRFGLPYATGGNTSEPGPDQVRWARRGIEDSDFYDFDRRSDFTPWWRLGSWPGTLDMTPPAGAVDPGAPPVDLDRLLRTSSPIDVDRLLRTRPLG